MGREIVCLALLGNGMFFMLLAGLGKESGTLRDEPPQGGASSGRTERQ